MKRCASPAEDQAIVSLNGGGFDAPDGSLRVSLANLPDEVYDDIGRRAFARGCRDAFEAAQMIGKASAA
jgi:aspartate 4-decarboxylase